MHAPNAHRRACTRHLARKQVLVSSDLAHTHLASGPYGYSPAAEPFDLAVGRWASDPVKHVSVQSRLSTPEFLSGLSPVAPQAEALLVEAARLAPDALSCGPRHLRPRTELVYLPRPLINFHRSQPTHTRARARARTHASHVQGGAPRGAWSGSSYCRAAAEGCASLRLSTAARVSQRQPAAGGGCAARTAQGSPGS